MATLNIGIKVNRNITGATTVNANAVAIVFYNVSSFTNVSVGQSVGGSSPVMRVFGPGQSVPASFNSVAGNASGNLSATYSLQSGVELINTQ